VEPLNAGPLTVGGAWFNGGAAPIVSVGAEKTDAEPSPLLPVTTERIRLPMSAEVST
jgi:hypothetical protein